MENEPEKKKGIFESLKNKKKKFLVADINDNIVGIVKEKIREELIFINDNEMSEMEEEEKKIKETIGKHEQEIATLKDSLNIKYREIKEKYKSRRKELNDALAKLSGK